MKYLKSFFGTLILFLLVLLITTPVIVVALLSGLVSLWFLFGEIIALPMSILIVIKLAVSDKLDWVLGLMSAASDVYKRQIGLSMKTRSEKKTRENLRKALKC